ncbi:hypothetical protein GCM10011408_21460 [Dyella caseinilytica]|nr:hypothetical protein GCM10011408_21460 [Dyella caseinilytica]
MPSSNRYGPKSSNTLRGSTMKPTEGKIIAWVIYDPKSGEILVQCWSRKEARKLAGKDGKIGVVRSTH